MCRAGVVDKHVQPPEGRDGLFDGGDDGVRIGGVGLNGDRLAAVPSMPLTTDCAWLPPCGVVDRNNRPVGCRSRLAIAGTDAARANRR